MHTLGPNDFLNKYRNTGYLVCNLYNITPININIAWLVQTRPLHMFMR